MPEIDPITGLPKELGVWEDITKEQQEIRVTAIKRKFGKTYTLIGGFDEKDIDIKDISKKLKAKFACGGTAKAGKVELQGDHRGRMKDALADLGFARDTIVVEEGPAKRA